MSVKASEASFSMCDKVFEFLSILMMCYWPEVLLFPEEGKLSLPHDRNKILHCVFVMCCLHEGQRAVLSVSTAVFNVFSHVTALNERRGAGLMTA